MHPLQSLLQGQDLLLNPALLLNLRLQRGRILPHATEQQAPQGAADHPQALIGSTDLARFLNEIAMGPLTLGVEDVDAAQPHQSQGQGQAEHQGQAAQQLGAQGEPLERFTAGKAQGHRGMASTGCRE